MSKAIIVFSGGQDSTTVLGKALHDGFECLAIGFNYGQKHAVELQQARKITETFGVPFYEVDVTAFGNLVGGHSALLHSSLSVSDQSPLSHMPAGIPASFVPNRNALFLTIAHGYAQVRGADTIWTGVCETDYSGYPDCRELFVKSLEAALNTGYQTNIKVITPLMHLTKAQTFKLAEECGVLDLVINESHTCYNGVRNSGDGMSEEVKYQFVDPGRFEWGHGCGQCPACLLRAKGWEEFREMVRIA